MVNEKTPRLGKISIEKKDKAVVKSKLSPGRFDNRTPY